MQDRQIAVALQRGAFIQALDSKGHLLLSIAADALVGYTGTSLSVRKGAFVQTFNVRGQLIGSVSAR